MTGILLILMIAGGSANTPRVEIDSGYLFPVSGNANSDFNPSVFIRPGICIDFDNSYFLAFSWEYVFLQGDFFEHDYLFDVYFHDYHSHLNSYRIGWGRNFGNFSISGGPCVWSFKSDREFIYCPFDQDMYLTVKRDDDLGMYLEVGTPIGSQTILKFNVSSPNFNEFWCSLGAGISLKAGAQ